MSAIFGILKLDNNSINEEHVSIMKGILSCYGLDEQDTYIQENLALGSCLNKISIYSEKDTPVYIEPNEKLVLVSDSLIYNRDELVNKYKLAENKNISNNELLFAAYKKWGEDCPKYINGDFTFAIREKDKLIIVRDHLGVRPLYYYFDQSIFAFATDYRAILALPFVPKIINEKMLYRMIINNEFWRKELTYFEGIYALLPAHILILGKDGVNFKKYWTPGLEKKIIYQTEQEYFKALYDMVLEAIKIRLNCTNLKIGAQLSGGLDSAVIDILASRELKKEQKELSALFSWAPSFDTYERQERDERVFIEQICRQEGFECIYFDVGNALAMNDLDKITAADANLLFAMMHEAESVGSKGVRIMLSGWGGDQGVSYGASLYKLLVYKEWKNYWKEVSFISRGSVPRLIKILISSSVLSFFRRSDFFSGKKNHFNNIDNSEFNKSMKKYKEKMGRRPFIDLIKRMESGEIQTRTEASAWIGAGHNVQYLFPFLDYHLVDFAVSIPPHMFYKNGINRYLFRKAFEGILPKELCYYIPKDDIARCTYRQRKINNLEKANELLEIRLDKTLFSKYIDFSKARELVNQLKKKEDRAMEHRLIKLLDILYNIQKLLEDYRS